MLLIGNTAPVTANTIPGFTRNSAPLWVRGQDAFLVIYGAQVQAHLVYSVELCKGSAVLYIIKIKYSEHESNVNIVHYI